MFAYHNNDEVPEPVVGGGDGCHGHSELDRRDLCAVEEVGTEETDGDEEVESEDEEGGSAHGTGVLIREASRDSESQHAA